MDNLFKEVHGDGFTTNGVLIYHPDGEFMNNNIAKFQNGWYELSSLGFLYHPLDYDERKEIPRRVRLLVKLFLIET